MTFDIDLTATTRDEGGILASFARQLDEFGPDARAELIGEMPPFRVDTSDGFFFEARRTYRVTLA